MEPAPIKAETMVDVRGSTDVDDSICPEGRDLSLEIFYAIGCLVLS
jgi:hypothetical protein